MRLTKGNDKFFEGGMSRPNPMKAAGFLILIIAIYAMMTLAKGALYVGNYEGDTAHLLDLAFRLSWGQAPHQDFVTPLGVLSFAPISLFLNLGFGAGHAIIYSQIFVAVLITPAVWWAMTSRLSGAWTYLFGFYAIVLVLALSQGQSTSHISLAMHYNRWAWAVAYVVVLTAVMPPLHRKSALADGVVIGGGMAFLALCKLTYFAAFAPPILLALILRKALPSIGIALVTGLAAIAIVTLWLGTGFWMAYFNDLLSVATSDVRPYPNKPFLDMLRLPTYAGGTLLIFLAVILLRQAKQGYMGLIMLVLAPAFFYVTFQNFGNDPQWMMLAALLLVLSRPEQKIRNGFGWELRQGIALTAAAVAALASPAAINMIYSPKVHLGVDEAEYTAFLPTRQQHADLLGEFGRAYEMKANIRLSVPDTAPGVLAQIPEEESTFLNGEALPACEIFAGAVGFFRSLAEELETAGYGPDTRFMITDIVSVAWMFGDFEPLEGGSPWYYGGLPGAENADLIVVPTCPYRMSERHRILGLLTDQGYTLDEVYRSDAIILVKPTKG